MDQITIDKLEVFANHGVYPEENALGQKFVISAVLYTNTRKAGITDNLEYSINYGAVSLFIQKKIYDRTYLEIAGMRCRKFVSGASSGISSVGFHQPYH